MPRLHLLLAQRHPLTRSGVLGYSPNVPETQQLPKTLVHARRSWYLCRPEGRCHGSSSAAPGPVRVLAIPAAGFRPPGVYGVSKKTLLDQL